MGRIVLINLTLMRLLSGYATKYAKYINEYFGAAHLIWKTRDFIAARQTVWWSWFLVVLLHGVFHRHFGKKAVYF